MSSISRLHLTISLTSSGVVLDLVNERGEQRVEHLQTAFDDETMDELIQSHAAALTG